MFSHFHLLGADPELKDALMSLSKVIVDPNWQVKEDEKEVYGIEHAGLHMTLKKLAQNDKIAEENSKTTFGECICSEIEDETVGTIIIILLCSRFLDFFFLCVL